MKPLIYLASPFSCQSTIARAQRYWDVCEVAGNLIRTGHLVLSPIAHSYGLSLESRLPQEWAFWKELDERLIDLCDELWVVQMDGWDESEGIRAEIQYARANAKPIYYVAFDALRKLDSNTNGALRSKHLSEAPHA